MRDQIDAISSTISVKDVYHMTNNDSSHEPREECPKKPYETPALRFDLVFEVSALSCGKSSGTQASCHQNRKVS